MKVLCSLYFRSLPPNAIAPLVFLLTDFIVLEPLKSILKLLIIFFKHWLGQAGHVEMCSIWWERGGGEGWRERAPEQAGNCQALQPGTSSLGCHKEGLRNNWQSSVSWGMSVRSMHDIYIKREKGGNSRDTDVGSPDWYRDTGTYEHL